jgi:hypothetical protein
MLNWLVEEKGIAPHIPVFDKSKQDDGTFSRGDFDMTRPATSTTAPADCDCVVHEVPRMSLFWPLLRRTCDGSHRWSRDRHLLGLWASRSVRVA